MMHYVELKVFVENDKIIVEYGDNTFKLYGVSMEDAAKFTKILIEEA